MQEDRFHNNRRRLLKIIAATGGAVAASTVLPGKWLKPIVELGVLPAHAQLSNLAIRLTDLNVGVTNNSTGPVGAMAPATLSGTFSWEALCNINATSVLTLRSKQCGLIYDRQPEDEGWDVRSVDGPFGKIFRGTADFNVGICLLDGTDTISLYVEDCGGRSNTVSMKVNAEPS